MSWITEVENVLTAFQTSNSIPYDYKRNESPTDQLPNTYIVYFMVDDPPGGHSDNVETSHAPRLQVGLYSRDKSTFLTVPEQIEAAFMAANFLRVGSGDIPYQTDTGHYGWRCDFRFYERR